MFTIDTHNHIITKNIPDFTKKFGYGNFIQLDHHTQGKAWMMQGNKRFREIEENCWDAEVRINQMKEHQADMQVICTIPVMFSYDAKPKDCLEIAQFLNDALLSSAIIFALLSLNDILSKRYYVPALFSPRYFVCR